MKRIRYGVMSACVVGMLFTCSFAEAAEPINLESYVRAFNYEARKDMKCSGKELLALLAKNEAVLVDIRFPDEQQAWSTSFGLKIPLNELPDRLNELPKDKIIVTACPHIDRSNIAMVYLRTQGYASRYLVDGLVGLGELLRGDTAREFMESQQKRR